MELHYNKKKSHAYLIGTKKKCEPMSKYHTQTPTHTCKVKSEEPREKEVIIIKLKKKNEIWKFNHSTMNWNQIHEKSQASTSTQHANDNCFIAIRKWTFFWVFFFSVRISYQLILIKLHWLLRGRVQIKSQST